MFATGKSLALAFQSTFGRFQIRPDKASDFLYILEINEPGAETQTLGHFCSINDAIYAVAQQETGYRKWDDLGLEKVPYRVYDITCWEFEEIHGTFVEELCS